MCQVTVKFENTDGLQSQVLACPTEGCNGKITVKVDVHRDSAPECSECEECGNAFFWDQFSPSGGDLTMELYTETSVHYVVGQVDEQPKTL